MGFCSPTTRNRSEVHEVYTTSEPQTPHLSRPRREAPPQAHPEPPRLIRITHPNPRYRILNASRRLFAFLNTRDKTGFQHTRRRTRVREVATGEEHGSSKGVRRDDGRELFRRVLGAVG